MTNLYEVYNRLEHIRNADYTTKKFLWYALNPYVSFPSSVYDIPEVYVKEDTQEDLDNILAYMKDVAFNRIHFEQHKMQTLLLKLSKNTYETVMLILNKNVPKHLTIDDFNRYSDRLKCPQPIVLSVHNNEGKAERFPYLAEQIVDGERVLIVHRDGKIYMFNNTNKYELTAELNYIKDVVGGDYVLDTIITDKGEFYVYFVSTLSRYQYRTYDLTNYQTRAVVEKLHLMLKDMIGKRFKLPFSKQILKDVDIELLPVGFNYLLKPADDLYKFVSKNKDWKLLNRKI